MKILLLLCASVVTAVNTPAALFGRHPELGPHCVRAASLLLVAAPAPAQMPPPGNPGHVEPAPGQTCAREASTPADHRCDCHRACKANVDEDGHAAPGAYVQEDPRCRVYCYAKSCRCPITGCE